jgi:hypothetical protein
LIHPQLYLGFRKKNLAQYIYHLMIFLLSCWTPFSLFLIIHKTLFTFYFLIKNKISNFHERLKDTQLNINNWLIKWLVFFSNQFDIAHLFHIFLSKEKFASNELRFTQTQKQKWGSVTRMSYTGTGWFKKISSLKINGSISSTYYYCNYRHLNWSFTLKIINLELVLSDPVMQPAFVRPSVHCNNSLLTKKKVVPVHVCMFFPKLVSKFRS